MHIFFRPKEPEIAQPVELVMLLPSLVLMGAVVVMLVATVPDTLGDMELFGSDDVELSAVTKVTRTPGGYETG